MRFSDRLVLLNLNASYPRLFVKTTPTAAGCYSYWNNTLTSYQGHRGVALGEKPDSVTSLVRG